MRIIGPGVTAACLLAGACLALAFPATGRARCLLSPGEARSTDRKARHSEAALQKRYRMYSGGKGTYYTGSKMSNPACGGSVNDQSMAVAVPATSPARCGDWVHIQYNGKSASAKVMDECGSCSDAHSLDLTKAVFEELADLSIGELKPIDFRILQ